MSILIALFVFGFFGLLLGKFKAARPWFWLTLVPVVVELFSLWAAGYYLNMELSPWSLLMSIPVNILAAATGHWLGKKLALP